VTKLEMDADDIYGEAADRREPKGFRVLKSHRMKGKLTMVSALHQVRQRRQSSFI